MTAANYRVGQKSKLLHFFISLLNIDQFSQFFTSGLCKKFATQRHATSHLLCCYTTL